MEVRFGGGGETMDDAREFFFMWIALTVTACIMAGVPYGLLFVF
jgi:hypothetical protein